MSRLIPRTRLSLPQNRNPTPPNPAQPQIPPEAQLSRSAIYAKLRPWAYTAAVVGIVVSCTLGGAVLKQEWQNRQARNLFAADQERKRSATLNESADIAGAINSGEPPVEEKVLVPGKHFDSSVPVTAQREQQQQSQSQAAEEQKKILQQLHGLESRRTDLLRTREMLAKKVDVVQERIRKRQEEERLLREREEQGGRIEGEIKVNR